MSEIVDLTYQKNRNVILNNGKDFYKNNKERLKEHARNKYSSLSEEANSKKENMRRIGIIICLKKKTKTKRISKKILQDKKVSI